MAGWSGGPSGRGHQDPPTISQGDRQSQVPAGGSHQWPVQTPQHCPATWSGHCGRSGTGEKHVPNLHYPCHGQFPQVMIVLEYMPNGDLRNFLHSMKAE